MSPDSIMLAETLLRVVVITEILVLIAAVLMHPARGHGVYRATLLLALCVIGYLLAPLLLHRSGLPQLAYPAVFAAIMVPTAFWYFCSTVFTDDFEPPPLSLVLALLTACLGMFGFVSGIEGSFDTIDRIAQSAKLLWLAAAFYQVFKDWRADLMTPRIRLRQLIVAVAGAYIAAIMIVELFLSGPPPVLLELLNSVLILLIVSVCVLSMLRIDRDSLLANIATPRANETDTEPLSTLAQRVLTAMGEGRAYAIEGVTLAQLATELNCPTPQLRQVINSDLGHRNFNAFINEYRVREVATRMAQADYRDTPLLTLALDAGFRSLAPFNRSFKEHYQVTPSAYRASLNNQ